MLHYLRLQPNVETTANDLGAPIAIGVSIDLLGLSWCKTALVWLSYSLHNLILTRGDESGFRRRHVQSSRRRDFLLGVELLNGTVNDTAGVTPVMKQVILVGERRYRGGRGI